MEKEDWGSFGHTESIVTIFIMVKNGKNKTKNLPVAAKIWCLVSFPLASRASPSQHLDGYYLLPPAIDM